MRKLLKKSILLFFLLCMALTGLLLISTKSPYREKIAWWTMSGDYPAGIGEVERYIASVHHENNYTKLVLGDSVCNQMFNGLQEYNDAYCLVGSNRGLTMAGQYLLLKEFLKTHQDLEEVFLVVGLDALESEIDVTYGYQYVVVPFSRTNLLSQLEDSTLEEMKGRFGTLFLNKNVALTIGDSSVGRKLYLNYLKEKYRTENTNGVEHGKLSDVSVLYLNKMYELCEENNIKLYLLPCPLADNGLRHAQAEALSKEFIRTGLDNYFPDYFNQIRYYPPEQFIDGVHFGGKYDNQEAFNEKIKKIYQDAGYMEELVCDFH